MIKTLIKTMVAVLILILWGCAPLGLDMSENIGDDQVIIWRQDTLSAEELTPTKKMLPNTINYTFFLVPKLNWLQDQSEHELDKLYKIYTDYSDQINKPKVGEQNIGMQNVAVWFWKNKQKMEPDTGRAMDFVYHLIQGRKLDLDINGGPYIVHLRLKQQYNLIVTQNNRRGTQLGTINERDLENLVMEANKPSNELMVLDLQECGMKGTEEVLNWMAMSLRNRELISSPEKTNAELSCNLRVLADDFIDKMEYAEALWSRLVPSLEKLAALRVGFNFIKALK